MKRALIIGAVGVALLGAALALTLLDQPGESLMDAMPPKVESDGPGPSLSAAPPVPEPAAPPEKDPEPSRPEPGSGAPPSFDVVRITPQGNAVIAGRAEPHSTVTVLDGGRTIGRAVADQRGEWVLLPDDPLGPGGRQLSLSARAPDAEAPVASDDVVVLVLPEPAQEAGGAIALAVPRDGTGASAVLQAPAAAVPAIAPRPAGGVSVDVVDYGSDGRVNIGGRAPPRTRVQVYLDNLLVGNSRSGDDGRWALTPEQPVRPGRYALRADQVAEDGKVAARAEIPFQMAEQAAMLPAGQSVVVQPGASLWRIARRTYGSGVRYSLIYEANQEHIRDPDLIYPGQIFNVPPTN
ncbi:LysM peptidoglycan-binding domain-containing protein [Skermanella mucosa]|uniref:LysM peptidoglycan-binding domain-containing protein n=1 Tax=Skermanella mucosa TaxID=1789672 RepID=UPI00192ADD0A|nr:LysM peptidoglycan-binding domain-containing protein [Skermanella mucosa]UEM20164.1 LysM peptidoglycan-binding domain-containing protein [Skermanella mucosa]